MKGRLFLCIVLVTGLVSLVDAQQRVKVDSRTPSGQIIMMDPKFVDASALTLTSVDSLHATGTYYDVDISSWRLTVSGKGVTNPLSLTYDQLLAFPMVKKRVLLICPGFFYDYLEWEGVSLETLLEKAGAGSYTQAVFTSVDGYRERMRKEELQGGVVMVALKGNGVPLPRVRISCSCGCRGYLRQQMGEVPDRHHLGVDRVFKSVSQPGIRWGSLHA